MANKKKEALEILCAKAIAAGAIDTALTESQVSLMGLAFIKHVGRKLDAFDSDLFIHTLDSTWKAFGPPKI